MASHQILDNIDAEINHFNALYPNISGDNSSKYYTCESFNQAFHDITRYHDQNNPYKHQIIINEWGRI